VVELREHVPVATLPGERLAGQVLLRGGVLAAGVLLVVVVAAAVLVPLQAWYWFTLAPLLLLGLAAAWRLARYLPARDVPGWTAWATVAIAAGHGVWAALTHAEQVVLRRDAGSYALYSHWIATRHGLPVEDHLAAFGGPAALRDPAFSLASSAYYQVTHGGGADIVPQFLIGAPGVYSAGFWGAGWNGLFVTPALVGALAVLAFAGLAARLAGPHLAPVAAGVFAVCQPVLHASRATYSEPLALLLLLAALALLVDATRAEGRAARWLGAAAGAGIGLGGLVRVDALRELVVLLPLVAVLAMVRHPAGAPFLRAALGGTVLSAAWAVAFSFPYLKSIGASLLPLVALAVLLGAASWVAVALHRRHLARNPARQPAPDPVAETSAGSLKERVLALGRLPLAAAALVVLAGLGLAARPLVMIDRQDPDDPGSRVVAGLQRAQGLTVDGGRTYAEHSVNWVNWWTGPVALLLALGTIAAGVALAVRWFLTARRAGTAAVPGWLGPLVVAAGSGVLTLYRPGITPDHPWADRRLVPVVLPAVIIASAVALAWLLRLGYRHWPAKAVIAAGVLGGLALLGPSLAATIPVAALQTERGEVRAAERVCSALRPGDAVLAVDQRARAEFPQLLRDLCDVPVAVVRLDLPEVTATDTPKAVVDRVAARVVAAGRRPVLISATSDQIMRDLGIRAELVTSLRTKEDQHLLVRRPDGWDPLDVRVWLGTWRPGDPGSLAVR
jgi:hypothetical protein